MLGKKSRLFCNLCLSTSKSSLNVLAQFDKFGHEIQYIMAVCEINTNTHTINFGNDSIRQITGSHQGNGETNLQETRNYDQIINQ